MMKISNGTDIRMTIGSATETAKDVLEGVIRNVLISTRQYTVTLVSAINAKPEDGARFDSGVWYEVEFMHWEEGTEPRAFMSADQVEVFVATEMLEITQTVKVEFDETGVARDRIKYQGQTTKKISIDGKGTFTHVIEGEGSSTGYIAKERFDEIAAIEGMIIKKI